MRTSLARRIFVERRAVDIPLILFLALIIAALAFFLWPLQRAVDGAKEEQYRAAQGVEAARQGEAKVKADRASKERADLELRKFYTEILPKDDRGAVGVASFALNRLAEQSKVTFKAGQWDREVVKDSRLSRVTGKVTLIGDYANIRKFLYEVETTQDFVIIESVELSQASASQNDSLLELSLQVATYYITNAQATVGGR